jgi:predicted ATPase
VWLVELSPVRDPADTVAAIAATLGLRAPGSAVDAAPARSDEEQVLAFLRDKRVLIVLDNCEHVVHEAARAVERVQQPTRKTPPNAAGPTG